LLLNTFSYRDKSIFLSYWTRNDLDWLIVAYCQVSNFQV